MLMPLIKSKSKGAFSKNVATEMHAGKPQKQAVAIAYSTRDRAPGMHHEVDPIIAGADVYAAHRGSPSEAKAGPFGGPKHVAPTAGGKR